MVSTIVPRIAEGGPSKVVPLAQIFINAIHHIPSYRRLLLFAMFVHSLSFHYLHTVLLLLLRKSILDSTSMDATMAAEQKEDIPAFCELLCAGFSPLVVLHSFTQILGTAHPV